MDTWVWLAAVAVFVLGTLIYLAFMIFLPEWVGITGKKALEAEESHRSDDVAQDKSLISKLQGEGKKKD